MSNISGAHRKQWEPPSDRCRATAHCSGEQCRKLAIRGLAVCRVHGGATGASQRKARERVAVAVAEAKLAHYLETSGYEPVENPLEALRQLAGEIISVKDWLRGQVTHLDHESAVQGEQISALMQLYSNFLDKADRSLTNIARLNIDDRLARIQQQQAQVMARVFAEAISRLIPGEPQKQQQARALVGKLIERYDT